MIQIDVLLLFLCKAVVDRYISLFETTAPFFSLRSYSRRAFFTTIVYFPSSLKSKSLLTLMRGPSCYPG